MNNLPVLYFAYGSNMSSKRLIKRIASAKPLIEASVENYNLKFNKISKDGTGKANLIKADGVVIGVIFEMNQDDIIKLDNIEKGYSRVLVNVQGVDGKSYEAVTYISDQINDTLKPSKEYLQYIIDGASEHQLPEYYSKYLQSTEVI